MYMQNKHTTRCVWSGETDCAKLFSHTESTFMQSICLAHNIYIVSKYEADSSGFGVGTAIEHARLHLLFALDLHVDLSAKLCWVGQAKRKSQHCMLLTLGER